MQWLSSYRYKPQLFEELVVVLHLLAGVDMGAVEVRLQVMQLVGVATGARATPP